MKFFVLKSETPRSSTEISSFKAFFYITHFINVNQSSGGNLNVIIKLNTFWQLYKRDLIIINKLGNNFCLFIDFEETQEISCRT